MSVWTAPWLFLNHNICVGSQRWRTPEGVCLFVYACMYELPSMFKHVCVYGVVRGWSRVCQGLKLLSWPSPFSSLYSFSETMGVQHQTPKRQRKVGKRVLDGAVKFMKRFKSKILQKWKQEYFLDYIWWLICNVSLLVWITVMTLI